MSADADDADADHYSGNVHGAITGAGRVAIALPQEGPVTSGRPLRLREGLAQRDCSLVSVHLDDPAGELGWRIGPERVTHELVP